MKENQSNSTLPVKITPEMQRLAKAVGLDLTIIQKQYEEFNKRLQRVEKVIDDFEKVIGNLKKISEGRGVPVNPVTSPTSTSSSESTQSESTENQQAPQGNLFDMIMAILRNPVATQILADKFGLVKPDPMSKLFYRIMVRNMFFTDYLIRGMLQRFGGTMYKEFVEDMKRVDKIFPLGEEEK